MDHSSHSHSHDHHDHMMSNTHATGLGSQLVNAVVNSTLVSNVSSEVVAGLQGAAETVSQIAKNISNMGHNEHMNHYGGHMSVMDMGSTDNSTSGGMHMSGMKMYFHFGYDETILFYGWKISTVGGLIGSMLGIFCIAVLYEGLKYVREFLFKKSLHGMQQVYSAANPKGAPNAPCPRNIPIQYMDEMLLPTTLSVLSSGHMIQTGLHMLQFVISYCLMLIFMTYNVWLCLACTLGAGCGYFLFGWKKSVVVDITEHCH